MTEKADISKDTLQLMQNHIAELERKAALYDKLMDWLKQSKDTIIDGLVMQQEFKLFKEFKSILQEAQK